MNKVSLASFLRHYLVSSIVIDDGCTILAKKFSADACSAGGPTVLQLRAAVQAYRYLDKHNINITVPQQLMRNAGHSLLYKPPYVSEVQPIELIWAHANGLVARQSHRTRTVVTAAVQTRIALESVTDSLSASCMDGKFCAW